MKEGTVSLCGRKMIYRILLLVTLTLASSVCGMFEPLNKDLHYQAQENSNITVEWRFAHKVGIDIDSLKIHCVQRPELKVFYHLDNSAEEAQHELFVGRVQCDEDALSAGRVRLHLSRVRADDSGQYLCRMATEFGKKVKGFTLNITAAPEEPTLLTPKPKPASRGRICLYVGLGLVSAAAAALTAITMLIRHFMKRSLRRTDGRRSCSGA